jgi:hypothetical protein
MKLSPSRHVLEHCLIEAIPVHPGSVPAPPKCMSPSTAEFGTEAAQSKQVSGHGILAEAALYYPVQPSINHWYEFVPSSEKCFPNRSQPCSHSLLHRQTSLSKGTLTVLSTTVRETEEVEGLGLYSLVSDPVFQKSHHPFMIEFTEEREDIGIQNPVHLLARYSSSEGIQRIVLSAPSSESNSPSCIRKHEIILNATQIARLSFSLCALLGVKIYLERARLRTVVNPCGSIGKLYFLHKDGFTRSMYVRCFGYKVPGENLFRTGFQTVCILQVIWVDVIITPEGEQ